MWWVLFSYLHRLHCEFWELSEALTLIIGENNKIAVFSAADGGAFKYEENQAITDTTTIRDIYSEVVIVEDGENNLFEVYMNNVIKPSEG